MKDEGANLATLVTALSYVVTCRPHRIIMPYNSTCFGHAMSEAHQYATMNEKVCGGMLEVSILKAQGVLQKNHNLGKEEHEGEIKVGKGCVLMSVSLKGN